MQCQWDWEWHRGRTQAQMNAAERNELAVKAEDIGGSRACGEEVRMQSALNFRFVYDYNVGVGYSTASDGYTS